MCVYFSLAGYIDISDQSHESSFAFNPSSNTRRDSDPKFRSDCIIYSKMANTWSGLDTGRLFYISTSPLFNKNLIFLVNRPRSFSRLF